MTVAIIDHETMTEMGRPDKTMPLRVVTSDEAKAGLEILQNGVTGEFTVAVDPGFREDIARSEVLEYRPPRERPESFKQCNKEFRVDYPTLERRMRWAGPFPVRPVQSMTGRLSIQKPDLVDVPRDPEGRTRQTLEKFAREASVEEIVEAVALLDDAEGVEEEPEETSTFALPAVWKMTGKVSTNKLAHRSAAHVQRLFNEAGWPIAVWFGEATRSYWVMDETGLHEFETITAMYQGMGWEAL